LAKLIAAEAAVLAGTGSDPAACVFYDRRGNDIYLHRLAVIPSARRMSLGHALVSYVEARAREAGCGRVRLGVRIQLPENQTFYARLGYAVLGPDAHPGYTRPTFLHMAKNIHEPPQRFVETSPPDPIWRMQYAAEARLLRLVFGDDLVDIHHIGSTAVPGIYAKPVIDIMPLVRDIRAVDAYNPIMQALGYRPMGEFGVAGRRYFPKGGNHRTHHVHIFEAGSPEVVRHLAFRDYLTAFPEKANAYSELKRSLATVHPTDMDAYVAGKDAMVRQLEIEALEWRAKNPTHPS
jgi:GrpB-like predicted nucleotidyltransferase (UPF0157 family)